MAIRNFFCYPGEAADVPRRRVLKATGTFALASGSGWIAACSRRDSASSVAPPQPGPTGEAPAPKRVALLWEGKALTGPSPEVAAEQQRRGWIEGKTVIFDRRAYKTPDDLPGVLSEIIALKPDLIMVYSMTSARAAKQATSTIPIVFSVGVDPVENGLVPSLARPGGNMTGFYWGVHDEKRLQLVKDLVPRARRIAYMHADDAQLTQKAADIGLRLQTANATSERDLDRFLAELRSARCDAIVISPADWMQRDYIYRRLAAEFIRMRMPSMGPGRLFVASGGLAAYQPTVSPERGIEKADRILHGANPGDLPVEMPTHYRLIINANTAKAIGLTIPSVMLQIADEIIS